MPDTRKLEVNHLFLKDGFPSVPRSGDEGRQDGRIITYQIFYRQLELLDLTKGLIISFHFVHILCQVLKNGGKGAERRRWKIRDTRRFERKTHH